MLLLEEKPAAVPFAKPAFLSATPSKPAEWDEAEDGEWVAGGDRVVVEPSAAVEPAATGQPPGAAEAADADAGANASVNARADPASAFGVDVDGRGEVDAMMGAHSA